MGKFILLRGRILQLCILDLFDLSTVLLLQTFEVLDVLSVSLVQCSGGLFELLARFSLELSEELCVLLVLGLEITFVCCLHSVDLLFICCLYSKGIRDCLNVYVTSSWWSELR